MKLQISILALLLTAGSVAFAQNTKERQRIQKSKDAIKELVETNWQIQKVLETAYGYAIFPNVGKGAIGIGGAHGDGVLVRGGSPIMRASMTQVTVGFQWGGQAYMEAVLFENKAAYDNFVEGKLKLSAQASAVAVTAGAAVDAPYKDGVAIFTMAKGGLMYEASVGGQKFDVKEWKN